MGERARRVAGRLLAVAAASGALAGLFLTVGPQPFGRLVGLVQPPAEVQAQEVVHGRSGHDVLVFREKDGQRRIIVPLSAAEARTLERVLRSAAPAAARALERENPGAAGERVLRASIDAISRGRVFSAHLTVERELGPVDVEASLAEAVTRALEQGAPIWMARDVLDRTGVTPEDARSLADSTRARTKTQARGTPRVLDI